ncbi:hypothetical protein Aconfl_08070 [Algoriphagus confluentis]|uniref:Uncharacterized protein n=1 Tax=Algoriphagus confluentis TaxID=1697556 RepID=A0ABQ6PJN5_9BACT|nr:hypothetical protein Aconfl_08070 [Algoriphagus confluentis]
MHHISNQLNFYFTMDTTLRKIEKGLIQNWKIILGFGILVLLIWNYSDFKHGVIDGWNAF